MDETSFEKDENSAKESLLNEEENEVLSPPPFVCDCVPALHIKNGSGYDNFNSRLLQTNESQRHFGDNIKKPTQVIIKDGNNVIEF